MNVRECERNGERETVMVKSIVELFVSQNNECISILCQLLNANCVKRSSPCCWATYFECFIDLANIPITNTVYTNYIPFCTMQVCRQVCLIKHSIQVNKVLVVDMFFVDVSYMRNVHTQNTDNLQYRMACEAEAFVFIFRYSHKFLNIYQLQMCMQNGACTNESKSK